MITLTRTKLKFGMSKQLNNPSELLFRFILLVYLSFSLLHLISLPILITDDGAHYIFLSSLIDSPDRAMKWDYVRTPIYPLLLHICFEVLGKHALSAVLTSTLLGVMGVLVLSFTIKKHLGSLAAIVSLVLVGFNPILVTYQHAVLTESGVFLWLATAVWALAKKWTSIIYGTIALIAILIVGFYYRPQVVYLSPAFVAAFLLNFRLRNTPSSSRSFLRSAFVSTLLIISIPLMIANSWQGVAAGTKRENMVGDMLLSGIIRHVTIPPEDKVFENWSQMYQDAIEASKRDGRLDAAGIVAPKHFELWQATRDRLSSQGKELLFRSVLEYPERYLRGVWNTLLVFVGEEAFYSENKGWASVVLGDDVYHAQLRLSSANMERLYPTFEQNIQPAAIRDMTIGSFATHSWLVWIGSIIGIALIPFAFYLGNALLNAFLVSIPAYLLLHALILATIDRYAFPAQMIIIGISGAFLCVFIVSLSRMLLGRFKTSEGMPCQNSTVEESYQAAHKRASGTLG